MIYTLPEISCARDLSVPGKTSVGVNIFNCFKESLQMYQLDAITSPEK